MAQFKINRKKEEVIYSLAEKVKAGLEKNVDDVWVDFSGARTGYSAYVGYLVEGDFEDKVYKIRISDHPQVKGEGADVYVQITDWREDGNNVLFNIEYCRLEPFFEQKIANYQLSDIDEISNKIINLTKEAL